MDEIAERHVVAGGFTIPSDGLANEIAEWRWPDVFPEDVLGDGLGDGLVSGITEWRDVFPEGVLGG